MSYSELVVSDSPLGYWELNTWYSLNPNIMSSSSNTYASQFSTVSSGIAPIVSGLGQSTALPLSTSSIVIPNNTSLLNSGNEKLAATMEIWFNMLTSSSNTTYLIKPSASNSYSLFQCYIKNDKIWLESASGKDFIELLNLEDHQYVALSYFNGRVSMTVNVDESVSIPCDSAIQTTQDRFIIGPGNNSSSLYVNAFAVYKYALNTQQMRNRVKYANWAGTTKEIASYDSNTVIDIDYIPNTSFSTDLFKSNMREYTSNVIFDGQSLFLREIRPVVVSSSAGATGQTYSLTASGIKFDTASAYAFVDASPYIDKFDFNNSTIRFQFDLGSTSSGTLVSLGSWDDYRSIVARVINSPSTVLRLSIIDNYNNEVSSVSSASLGNGSHNVAINFSYASITLFVNGASYSSNIKNTTYLDSPDSIFIGSNSQLLSTSQNFIGNGTFTDSTNGWYVDTGTSASIEVSGTKSFGGTTSMLIRNGASGTVSAYYFNNLNTASPSIDMIPITASNQYYLEAKVLTSSAVRVNANIRYYNASLTLLGTVSLGASVTAVSSSWSTASVLATAPASAAYAVPYFTASNTAATASIYVSDAYMRNVNNAKLANGYNNNIRNFAIDPLTSSVTNFSSRGRLMLKFENNLNVSQTGSAILMLRDFNFNDNVIEADISYSNPSSNVIVEHGKNSGSVVSWQRIETNMPLTNYDFNNITADEIRVTLSTDDSWYDIPTLRYLSMKYHTASTIYSQDGKFYIDHENFSTSSLSFPVLNDTKTTVFSKSNNLGFKTINGVTGGLKIGPVSGSVREVDFLFKVDSFSRNSPIISDGTNFAYLSTTGSLVFSNPSSSMFINGASVSGRTLVLGETYHFSTAFASARPYVWIGYHTTASVSSRSTFGNINISTSSNVSNYGSAASYAAIMYNNYQGRSTQILGNNILPEQVASMEIYSEVSGSWGFTSTNASVVRSSACAVHGGFSVRMQPTASSVIASCQTNSSASVLTPVVPGRNYVAMAKMTGNVSRLSSCNIIWYSASSVTASISRSFGSAASTTTSWNNFTISASAPLNANYAAVQVSASGATTTDVFYIDEFGLFAEGISNWTIPRSNSLDLYDGEVQASSDTEKNYFSPDGTYFEMTSLPKIKIVTKQSTNTNI